MQLSYTLTQIQALVARGAIRISDHGYDELVKDDILVSDILAGLGMVVVVEDYPDAMRGPSVLVLEWDSLQRPVHVVWANSERSFGTSRYGDCLPTGS